MTVSTKTKKIIWISMAVVLAPIGFAVVVGGVWFVFILIQLSGVGHENAAENKLAPIIKEIEGLGGQKLCSNGDNGYGIDNTMPWRQAYYQLQNDGNQDNQVINIFAKHGLRLTEDTAHIAELQNGEGYGGEEYNEQSDYLISVKDGYRSTVTINRHTNVKLYCDVDEYGRSVSTGEGLIIDIHMSAPEVDR